MENYQVKENECYIDKLSVKNKYRIKGFGRVLYIERLYFANKRCKVFQALGSTKKTVQHTSFK